MRIPPVISFLALAFGISWCIVGVGASFGVYAAHPAYVLVAGLAMFGPAVAAVIQWRVIDRAPWAVMALHPRLIKWPGIGLTVALAACIVPLALFISHLMGDVLHHSDFGHVELSGERFSEAVSLLLEDKGLSAPSTATTRLATLPGSVILLIMLLVAAISAFTVNLPFMLGEELGWRGYLFAATRHWSAAKRVAITGPVWGLWHAPLILMGHNYPGYQFTGIVMMMGFCTLLSVLFDFSRHRSDSVWGACVLHGMINGSAGAFAIFAWDGHFLVASPAGFVGMGAVLLLCLVVLAFDGPYRRTFFRPVDMP
ncbi:MAG: CPBP family intramembrane glutamic endopeptidase [Flavobacteriales bacterium]